jgi:hypothetical protein
VKERERETMRFTSSAAEVLVADSTSTPEPKRAPCAPLRHTRSLMVPLKVSRQAAASPSSAVGARKGTPSVSCAPHSDEKVANRDLTGFRVGDRSHGAVTRRPPISLDTMVVRTGSYTYDASVWDVSIVQGPFSVAPCQTITLRFATFASL